MIDPTDEKISTLQADVALRAYWLVKSAREAGIPLMVISGLRSASVNESVGGASASLHLVGRAFDVQVLGYTRDELPYSWWAAVASWAEANLGLSWGGWFSTPDVNHFYL